MAAPPGRGGSATYGIELLHPRREGRCPPPLGRHGLANHRWMVGGQLGLRRNQGGWLVGGAGATAHVADHTLHWLSQPGAGRLSVLSAPGCQAAAGAPRNLKRGQRGEWQDRRLVETGLSRLTLVCHLQKVRQRGWAYVQARLAFTMAAGNGLVQWPGFRPYASGFVPLAIAECSL